MNIRENVMLGEYRSYDDLGLIFKGKTISAPSPKTNKVSVPGRNGSVDFSEVLGGMRYENRKITMRFQIYSIKYEYITAKMSDLMMKLHGQSVHIIFADDEAFFWKGRLTVGDPKISKGKTPYVDFNITADVEPYKYSIYTTDEEWLWDPFDFENSIVNELSDIVIKPNSEMVVEIVTLPNDRVTAPIIICDTEKRMYIRPRVNIDGEWVNMTENPIVVYKGSTVLFDIPLEKNKEYQFILRNNYDTPIIASINYLGGSL